MYKTTTTLSPKTGGTRKVNVNGQQRTDLHHNKIGVITAKHRGVFRFAMKVDEHHHMLVLFVSHDEMIYF